MGANAIMYTNTGNFDLRQTTNEPRVYGLRVNYRFGKPFSSPPRRSSATCC